jgi:tight adherence protein C
MSFLEQLLNDAPQLRPWLPAAAFVAIAAVAIALGWLVIRLGRRRATSGVHRRHLVFGMLTRGLANAAPILDGTWTKIQREVRQAGYYHHMAAHEFLAIRNVLCLGVLILTMLVLIVSFDPVADLSIPIASVGLVALVLANGLPRLVLQSKAKSRVQRIQTQLPDGLDMITMCMTGGLSLNLAMERVGAELHQSHPDLSMELGIIRRQADAHSLENSLEQFAKRIDVPEVQTLAAIVAQTESLGANVASALRDFADGIRRSFRQRAEERGNRTSVQMMLPVALCLAPPVYILLLAPAVMELRSFVIQENAEDGILSTSNVAELTSQPAPSSDEAVEQP